MILIFLLQFINSFESSGGSTNETLCTFNACYTLHMDKVSFKEAHQKCVNNGGHLMTVRDRHEEDVLHSLLSQSQRHFQDRTVTCWIGLHVPQKSCVSANKTLWGFKWTSGEGDSHNTNWDKDPALTCLKERCVSVNYTVSGQNQLKWTAGSCKRQTFYACKFYFKGMCKPLVLLGDGQISYTLPFSEMPERRDLKIFPLGTYVNVVCNDQNYDYSVCHDFNGIIQWSNPGPFCKTENQRCTIKNGGCEHECQQHGDEVKCFCKEDYNLVEDGLSCRIRNLCGVDTCEFRCIMKESGYSCICPHGFKLHENQRNCSDIDECQSNVCEGQVCLNTHGSYKCACTDGFEMINGKCIDINECDQSRCQQKCRNSVGSYSCYCNEGFKLSADSHSCVDINECDGNTCKFRCINTFGSYVCTCPPGSRGLNCTPKGTETLIAPTEDTPGEDGASTESLNRATVESYGTNVPFADLANVTHDVQPSNASYTTGFANVVSSSVIICVLGSVIPLLVLIAVTLAIAIVRCSHSRKEAKKKKTTGRLLLGGLWCGSPFRKTLRVHLD
ncbi:hypothetical protein Q5P01_020532 [Channa striata]|uniref:Complement component C1q receptor n=1 Tax=Channa striata TaxID=64152 RepID=A0AA88LXU3_CHASR|nr:hypothetical protein Q5P01_020532 [Channa striata]